MSDTDAYTTGWGPYPEPEAFIRHVEEYFDHDEQEIIVRATESARPVVKTLLRILSCHLEDWTYLVEDCDGATRKKARRLIREYKALEVIIDRHFLTLKRLLQK